MLLRFFVSVPLRGFAGLKDLEYQISQGLELSFSPLAGIRWIERMCVEGRPWGSFYRFSPLAGIRWIESGYHSGSIEDLIDEFQSPCGDSLD